jgi:hypothetical protein
MPQAPLIALRIADAPSPERRTGTGVEGSGDIWRLPGALWLFLTGDRHGVD